MPSEPTTVRTATPRDRMDVRRILDAAMLEVGDVESRLEAGDVLVAVAPVRAGTDEEVGGRPASKADGRTGERILGALVCQPREHGGHISAIAVRRRHRARGIGTALVERVLEREGRVTAHFDEDVRPFYESLAFTIRRIDEHRYRGERARG